MLVRGHEIEPPPLSAGGDFATLDYGDDAPTPDVYTGRAVDLADLELRPLRRFDGWEVPRG